MKNIVEKYASNIFEKVNKENFNKIIEFLKTNNCDYIEDIVTDYFDIFIINYDEFINKYNKLNQKYHNNFLLMASNDMNLLEEFFY